MKMKYWIAIKSLNINDKWMDEKGVETITNAINKNKLL